MVRKLSVIIMVSLISLGIYGVSTAQQNKRSTESKSNLSNVQWPKIDAVNKKVTGEVGGISNKFIAVVYGRNEKDKASLEMAFNIGSHVNIVNKKSMKEIGIGDTVEVEYQEITRTEADGKKSSKSVAQVVTFLKAGAKVEPVIPITGAAKAKTESPDGLRIKDFRN
jgi:hypothetical protein